MQETGLPPKYAKMGFKKGWREFKKTDAYRRRVADRTKSKPKPKKKTTPAPRSRTTVSKPKSKSRPKGKLERITSKHKKEFSDWRRALGYTTKQSHFKRVKNSWSLKIGPLKSKNVKLSKAMTEMRKKVRKAI